MLSAAPEVDISLEIKNLKKDISSLKDKRGTEFAAEEIASIEKNISAAEELKSSSPGSSVEKLYEARYGLIIAQEKTRKAVTLEKNSGLRGLNASFGLSGTFGLWDMYVTDGTMRAQDDGGFGAGITVEKMFSNRFGLYSGLSYMTFKIHLSDIDKLGPDMTWKTEGIYMPLMLITSFSTKSVSLSFLTGISFYNMFSSELLIHDDLMGDMEQDVLPYISKRFLMASGGSTLKFRLGDYTDFYIGAIAEISAFNVMGEENTEKAHMFSLRGVSGILFRTDIFPMR
jgi:hypothetical protein